MLIKNKKSCLAGKVEQSNVGLQQKQLINPQHKMCCACFGCPRRIQLNYSCFSEIKNSILYYFYDVNSKHIFGKSRLLANNKAKNIFTPRVLFSRSKYWLVFTKNSPQILSISHKLFDAMHIESLKRIGYSCLANQQSTLRK